MEQEAVGPGALGKAPARVAILEICWRFAAMRVTLSDLEAFLQALFLPPGTIPGLDAKTQNSQC